MDWAAPDVSAPVGPPPAPVGSSPPVRTAAPDRPRLGPRTAADILDGSFAMLRQAPATIIGFTAVFAIPSQLLAAFLLRNDDAGASVVDLFESGDPSLLANDQSSGSDTMLAIVSGLAPSLALVFVAAGITRLVSAWQVGHDLTIREMLRGTRRLAWPLLASFVLVKVAEGIGFVVCFLPAIAVMACFLVTAPAIAAEDLGPIAGMRRSARLVGRRFWPVLGIGVLSAIVSTFFSTAVEAIPLGLLWVTGADSYSWIISGLSGAVTALLTMPIVAGAAALTYLDLRVRTEGLDLELAALDAFPSPV